MQEQKWTMAADKNTLQVGIKINNASWKKRCYGPFGSYQGEDAKELPEKEIP